jgi:NADH:ubiquinone oxidoreductase subunit B-like Fe-S oxidoreductase
MSTVLFAEFPDQSAVVIRGSDILLPSDVHMAECCVKFSFLLDIYIFMLEEQIFLCSCNMTCKTARK